MVNLFTKYDFKYFGKSVFKLNLLRDSEIKRFATGNVRRQKLFSNFRVNLKRYKIRRRLTKVFSRRTRSYSFLVNFPKVKYFRYSNLSDKIIYNERRSHFYDNRSRFRSLLRNRKFITLLRKRAVLCGDVRFRNKFSNMTNNFFDLMNFLKLSLNLKSNF